MKHHRTLIAVITVALIASLAGCGSLGKTHQENKDAAAARWNDIRSGYKLSMAKGQFETGDLDEAEKTLVEALSVDPMNPRLHTLAGRIALERNQLEKSFQRLSRAIELDNKIPEPHLKLADPHYYVGIVLQRWKQYDRAYAAYMKAYELQSDNISFLLAVSEMLVAMDKQDDAIKLLESKTIYFDQNAGIRAGLGQLYMMRGNYLKAGEYYRQASLLRPDDLRLLEDLAMARMGAGDFSSAIEDFKRLMDESKPERKPDLLRLLASAQLNAGRMEDARASYLELTRLDRTDVAAWTKLAEISLQQNELGGALTASNRVIALAGQDATGYLLAGLVWQRRGDIDKALTHFDRAAQLAPEKVDAVILRGITLEQAGRLDAAAAAYTEAKRRNPEDPRAGKLLSQVADKTE
ncbi:MAG: tetratricopeptide repeat protein [Phycisphaeraceae bacterium]